MDHVVFSDANYGLLESVLVTMLYYTIKSDESMDATVLRLISIKTVITPAARHLQATVEEVYQANKTETLYYNIVWSVHMDNRAEPDTVLPLPIPSPSLFASSNCEISKPRYQDKKYSGVSNNLKQSSLVQCCLKVPSLDAF